VGDCSLLENIRIPNEKTIFPILTYLSVTKKTVL
jgi:hypothetical protein